jgi:hypothetical protein
VSLVTSNQRGDGVQRGGQLIVVMCFVVPGVDTALALTA